VVDSDIEDVISPPLESAPVVALLAVPPPLSDAASVATVVSLPLAVAVPDEVEPAVSVARLDRPLAVGASPSTA
jgi:hypothetical protein